MKLLPLLVASLAFAFSASASVEAPAGSCCGAADAKKKGCCAEKSTCCAEKKEGACCAEAKKEANCAACAESAKAEAPAAAKMAAKPADTVARHPLKGVILEVRADRGALVVKHEEIPGVMRAMTMSLKVDEATLKAAKKNQAINALLVRKADGWWLEEVKPAS